ncbi:MULTISPECIES: ABC transporter ATP-binding protein [Oleiagrimonas]|jgi:ABC-2 type transport system ATP-binding protein|uniref:ABC transporter ATP-binding protein n=1 Tax=Oleiagrimonas citrea TaxID=1665687 RepID=A0A846ZRC0_9GAMM|nr:MULTISPECIES: ABC transporter ATP-binding protein [Oleiagrimonas]NKZ40088.1 ABC transporter ATP-binding protein [Oleiagrimonas citrea]RAP57117.1 ABC transporter [Oleiagrimonas sp. MCCC 1A03011]
MNAVLHMDEPALDAPLSVRGVAHAYEGRNALRGVDLDLPRGSVLGLIGRNGAGKSTLIRAMLGLLEPLAGEALVFGEPALRLSDAAKARIAYVPQQPEALAWLTATQMFDYLSRFYPNWDERFVERTMQRWELPTNRVMAKLSPGERQRVDLVRALASQPDLLVLDEPAAALDPVARRDLLREVALRAGEAGATVLFSTHIVSDLERAASEIAFLHDGQLLLHCGLDETKERYARLWLPAGQSAAAPPHALSRHRHDDGSLSVVVERAVDGSWPEAARLPGARVDALGLEDLFVEIAE